MSNFDSRMQQAIQRGQRTGRQQADAAQAAALSEEHLKRLHSKYRLELAEHIEVCLKGIPDHFPGFQWESVASDRGWGAAVFRNDVQVQAGKTLTLFSRLEMTIRPYTSAHVLEISSRGTIHNREVFQRSQYQLLSEAQVSTLAEQLDLWILEFVELYAARTIK
jgi:hypothetical protein